MSENYTNEVRARDRVVKEKCPEDDEGKPKDEGGGGDLPAKSTGRCEIETQEREDIQFRFLSLSFRFVSFRWGRVEKRVENTCDEIVSLFSSSVRKRKKEGKKGKGKGKDKWRGL